MTLLYHSFYRILTQILIAVFDSIGRTKPIPLLVTILVNY